MDRSLHTSPFMERLTALGCHRAVIDELLRTPVTSEKLASLRRTLELNMLMLDGDNITVVSYKPFRPQSHDRSARRTPICGRSCQKSHVQAGEQVEECSIFIFRFEKAG